MGACLEEVHLFQVVLAGSYQKCIILFHSWELSGLNSTEDY